MYNHALFPGPQHYLGRRKMVIVAKQEFLCEEERRLKDDRQRKRYWKKWGSYVAERQWATGMQLERLN